RRPPPRSTPFPYTTLFRSLRDRLQGQGGLARGFRTVDLDHSALGQAADAEGDVEHQRAGADDFGGLDRAVAHAHDRALAELLLEDRKSTRLNSSHVKISYA